RASGRALDRRDRGFGRALVHPFGQEHVCLRYSRPGAAVPAAGNSWQKIDLMAAEIPTHPADRLVRLAVSVFGDVSPRATILLAVLLVVLLIAPWLVSDYLLTVLIVVLYFAFTGQAWNIMMGFAGQLSLGHSIYAGLGGYIAAVLF